MWPWRRISMTRFLSTPSARRATLDSWHYGDNYTISIHALREEGDCIRWLAKSPEKYFYPRPPRGGRRHALFLRVKAPEISIHALREEGDKLGRAMLRSSRRFLSTPSARRATHAAVRIDRLLRFLSTPSARRATQRPGGLC